MAASRRIAVRPGWDCERSPCGKNGCGTEAGAGHGIHCDEWVYVIGEGDLVLTAVVMSGVFPEGTPPLPEEARRMFPMGCDVGLHVGFETRGGSDMREASCEWVGGRPCSYLDYGGLAMGHDLVRRRFNRAIGKDQTDRWWSELERLYVEWSTDAYRRRVETP